MRKTSSILVTGCAGFIGSNFTRIFGEQFPDIQIIGIDNFATGRKSAVTRNVKLYEGSICDAKLLDTIFKKHKPEYVFHFAALPRISFSVAHPFLTTEVNIGGTVLLLEKSRDYNVRRFIFSSSSSVYGGAKQMPTREKDNYPRPISPYAMQKYAGEHYCRLFSELYGLDTICLRYFTVYGPGQYGDSPYSTIISAWLTGLYFPKEKKLFLEGTGKQSRDFCYVDNAVQANIKGMLSKKDFRGEAFNVAHGERTSLLEVKKQIESLTGKKLLLEKRPWRKGDVMHTHADISKAKKMFGYKPTVSFMDGLRLTVDWFNQRKS